MSAPAGRLWLKTCETCGKRCFSSKKRAKDAIRQHGPEGRDMRAYKCGDLWHMGHLPAAVRRGMASRAELGGAA